MGKMKDLAIEMQDTGQSASEVLRKREHAAVAKSLRGKFVRFAHERPTHPGRLVISVTEDGMIELSGMSGQFAPHLFVRVDRPHSAAEGNS